MGILDRIQKKNKLARIEAENREFEKKFGKPASGKTIPSLYTGVRQDAKIVKEIRGTVTNEIIAFEREDGSWDLAGTDHHKVYTDEKGNKQIASIKSPLTAEFEAQQEISYPIFSGATGL